MRPETIAWIGLGANLPSHAGTPAETLASALQHLGQLPESRLDAVSGFYRSSPVDSDGPLYSNQVARLHTRLPAETLLQALQGIEQAFGRNRPYRNAPRTLDLDLLLYGDEAREGETLSIPHPRMHQRLFVLMPLAEIEPSLRIPGHGRVDQLVAAVQATDPSQFCERVPAAPDAAFRA